MILPRILRISIKNKMCKFPNPKNMKLIISKQLNIGLH